MIRSSGQTPWFLHGAYNLLNIIIPDTVSFYYRKTYFLTMKAKPIDDNIPLSTYHSENMIKL